MPRTRALAVALLAIALLPSISLAQNPDGCVGVFFDQAGTQLTRTVAPFTPFSFYIIAFDPPGGISAWELSSHVPPAVTVTLRSLPPSATNFAAGNDNWIVGTGGVCYPDVGTKVLATYSGLLLSAATDVSVCLGPANPTTFPGTWGPGYLACFVPGDLRTFIPCAQDCGVQQRCAVINPVTPTGCTGVEIAVGNRTGTFQSFVDVPVTIQKHQFGKRADANQLAGLDLTFTWDQTLGSIYQVMLAPLASTWSMEYNATPGSVRVSMASLTPIATPTIPTDLLQLRFQLTDQTGASPISITSARAFDLARQSIATSLIPGMLYVQCDKGDPVDDNEVNSADALLALQVGAGLYQPQPLELCAADMNSDGVVAAGDAVLILRRAVGLGAASPTLAKGGRIDLAAGSRPGELRLAYQSVAGLEVVLTYNPVLFSFAEATAPGSGGITIANSNYPGYVKISFAKAVTGSGEVLVRFAGVPPGGTFRLIDARAFDEAGAPKPVDVVTDEVNLVVTGAPSGRTAVRPVELLPAYPNPFNPTTELRFRLAEAGDARLRIYDLAGRQVRAFELQALQAGEHTVLWNGRDDAGLGVASGTYVIQLDALAHTQRQRVTLLK